MPRVTRAESTRKPSVVRSTGSHVVAVIVGDEALGYLPEIGADSVPGGVE